MRPHRRPFQMASLRALLVLSASLTLTQQASLPQENGGVGEGDPAAGKESDATTTSATITGSPTPLVEQFVSIDYDEPAITTDHPDVKLGILAPLPPLPPPVPDSPKNACHYELNGEKGLFTSDKFPENYAESSNCTWNITVPEGNRIRLTFYLVNVEYHNTCTWDWIKVIEQNGTVLKQFCGYLQQELNLLSTNNTLLVQLYSDSVIQGAGFMAAWEAVPPGKDGSDPSPTGEAKAKPGYILSFPQSFSLGDSDSPEETLCLQLINVKEAGKAVVSLFSSENLIGNGQQPSAVKEVTVAAKEGGEGNGDLNCFSMQLPPDFRKSVAVLSVNGTFGDYRFLSYKAVKVLRSSTMVLVQTDKGDYRPGQEVRIRLLFLDSELKPSRMVRTVDEVFVSDPASNRVKQWKDVALNSGGLAQLAMQLEKEPELGAWQITANFRGGQSGDLQSEMAQFTVSENVLPKFEVRIEGPDHMVEGQPGVFRVCATYTHGAKLKGGSVNVTFTTSYTEDYWGASQRVLAFSKLLNASREGDGCVEASLNRTELEQLSRKAKDLQILAVYQEAGTGVEHNTTHTSTIHSTPFRLDFGGSSTSHMISGAFPYVGTLRAVDHDGDESPSAVAKYAGLKVKVCARLFTSLDDMRNYVNGNSHLFYGFDEDQFKDLAQKVARIQLTQSCQTLSMGPDGKVDFSVNLEPSLPSNVTKLSVTAEVVQPDEEAGSVAAKAPSAKHDVGLSHNEVGKVSNFMGLTIHDLHGSGTVACNKTNLIDVYFSARKGSKASLTWYFSSGGSIVEEGSAEVEVSGGGEDLTTEYLGNAVSIVLPKVGDDDLKEPAKVRPEDSMISKHTIQLAMPLPNGINQRVSSTMRLLVYLRNENGDDILTVYKSYQVQPCDIDPPRVSWSAAEARPGSPVTLALDSSGGDVCAYSVVDKSVELVKNPNKITKPRLQDIKENLASQRIVADSSGSNDQGKSATHCRSRDLVKAFEQQGLFVLTDQALAQDPKCGGSTLVVVDEQDRSGNDPPPPPFPVPLQLGLGAQPEAADFAGGPLMLQAAAAPAMAFGAPQPLLAFKEVADVGGGGAESKGSSGGEKVRNRVAAVSDPSAVVSLRNYFPETWLFDMVENGGDSAAAAATLNLTTPHTITTWVADAFCIDRANGLRVSNQANLLVNQDFFVDLNLPYSVKRGERFPLNASLFNNAGSEATNLSLPMVLTVLEAPQAEYLVEGDPQVRTCLPAGESKLDTFMVTPKVLDEVNITVEARISSEEVADCATSVKDSDGFKDTVRKPVVVKPEGFPVEEVQNEFVCPGKAKADVNLRLGRNQVQAEDLVDGSVRAWLSVTGDIMAPSLANLEKLVQQPTGCGEQNMMGMVPNIYLLKYLTARGAANSTAGAKDLEDLAKRYMRIGYERQQQYRFEDGSYSVWGPSTDSVGSLWLTAFVVRAFAQASPYIAISGGNVWQSVQWILNLQQQASGDVCFKPSGYVIHDELQGEDGGAMTASVLIALLEVKANNDNLYVFVDKAHIKEAFDCLWKQQQQQLEAKSNSSQPNSSIYKKAMVAYVTNLYHKLFVKEASPAKEGPAAGGPSAEGLVEELLLAANASVPGVLFWTTGKDNLARDVETTAYAVLSLVMQGKMAEALKAIKWLASNRNSLGGFVSTQDTMVALHALSDYSAAVRSEETDLQVVAKLDGVEGQEEVPSLAFRVDKDNELLLQKERLTGGTSGLLGRSIALEATGTGCFIAQSVVRYNVKTSPDQQGFDLNATLSKEDEELVICASYRGSAKDTDMVVMEVELLSGFKAYRKSLDNLKKVKGGEEDTNEVAEDDSGRVKKYEYDEKEGKVVLYFDRIPREARCYSIKLKRSVVVEDLKPAIIKIYDYYNPKSTTFSLSYNLS